MKVGVVAIVVILLALAGGWFGWTTWQTGRAIAALAADTRANLIAVKGGTFTAGNFHINVVLPDGTIERRIVATPQNALPPHDATVSDFALLAHEALSADFDLFLSQTGHPPQTHDDDYGRGIPDHPAIMTWQEATAYCTWLGDLTGLPMRLPTEVEWEYAARSRGALAAWGTAGGRWVPGETVADVDTPGVFTQKANLWAPSPMGFYDLAQGAREWVSDTSGTSRISKGGSSRSSSFFETIPGRNVIAPVTGPWPGEPSRSAEQGYPYHVGFTTARCASDQGGLGPGVVDFTAPDPIVAYDVPGQGQN